MATLLDMPIHLRAADLIDPATEAHYSFKTIRPVAHSHGQIIQTQLHDHDFYELFLITHGHIWHLINGQEVLLPAGSLTFIRPRDCHSFREHGSADCGLINLAFPAQTIAELFAYLGDGFEANRLLTPKLPPTVTLDDEAQREAVAALTRLHNVPVDDTGRMRSQLRLLLADLIGRHFRDDLAHVRGSMPEWLLTLCQQMQEPDNLRGGVARMQQLAHTSPSHLSRTCKRELGCTPTDYVNNLRLTYAANLLLHGDQSISDIGLEVGLNNLSYFYRLFRARFGRTPAQFRAQNRQRSIL